MKTKPPDIEADALVRLVNEDHDLTLSSLSFLPEGEDSFAFAADGADGTRYFLRLEEDTGQRNRLESVYDATETLARHGLPAIVPRRRLLQGEFLSAYGPYLVALFPFMEGRNLVGTASSEDRARLAEVVAALHETSPDDLQLPREGLENPFEAPIRRALSRAESPMPPATRHAELVSALLRAHWDAVEASLRRMESFQREHDTLIGEWVLSHGEPHTANVLKDSRGRLHLTDWGNIAVAPPERDLFAFTGPHFEHSLKHYVRRRGSVRLSPRLFEFYHYRWALQEIADYTTRILFREMGPEEDAHAWRELQDYLPPQRDDIATAGEEIREVLVRLSM